MFNHWWRVEEVKWFNEGRMGCPTTYTTTSIPLLDFFGDVLFVYALY
jgi:hypothetical protein